MPGIINNLSYQLGFSFLNENLIKFKKSVKKIISLAKNISMALSWPFYWGHSVGDTQLAHTQLAPYSVGDTKLTPTHILHFYFLFFKNLVDINLVTVERIILRLFKSF
jgi:hypothetical protein